MRVSGFTLNVERSIRRQQFHDGAMLGGTEHSKTDPQRNFNACRDIKVIAIKRLERDKKLMQ